jgi:hypothetical protein
LGQAEHAKQLPIQIIAVSDDYNSWIFHCSRLHNSCSKASHCDAFAAALRMPNNATLV